MRRRFPISTLALGVALSLPAHADEGMWMPSQLPQLAKPLRHAGFKGDPKTLADVTAAPLSAVVRAGGGTGAFVSPDGLVLTNHHVAYGVIQYNSKPERNLIDDGFIAGDRAAELPANPDFRVLVTVGYDKVTDHHRAGAEYIVSADMSCIMHQKGCAERLGLPIKFIHIAQILNGARE